MGSNSRRRKFGMWSVSVIAAVSIVAAILVGVAVVQNDFDLNEQAVRIPYGPITFDGVLATPTDGTKPLGLVVVVHGDGPINATYDGFYRPLWESFARAGYATLSWNKQGIDGSAGDWLNQSMQDRAAEVEAAIAWAAQRPDIDPKRIGLWGSSQAGWVMPKVARQTPSLCFMIASSPAINWVQQGRYNTLAELREEGAGQTEIDRKIARSDLVDKLLADGATFEQYSAAVGGELDGITPQRWLFITKNFRSDATADLAASKLRVLLLLAGHDINVDVANTREVYERVLPPGELEVKFYPDATHSMVQKQIEDSSWRLPLTAIFDPRGLFAPGVLADQEEFLKASTQAC